MLRKYLSISARLVFMPKQRNIPFDLLSILNLGLEFSMISYVMVTKYHINVTWCHTSVTVTQSHDQLSQWKIVEGFKRNDII